MHKHCGYIAHILFLFVSPTLSGQTVSSSSILSRKQIPILCYHQIRDWKPKDSRADKDYIIPPSNFRAQMKMLADRGYHTILPDELYNYLVTGKPLPDKPVMLTFDDTNEDQFGVARPELIKYNFKAVYFIITGKIGTHKWFMTAHQIKQLSDEGNVIGCHTRDHLNFRKLKETDWVAQIDGSKKQLEQITGKPVYYFAFPFGYWNRAGLPSLHKSGFKAAFQLEEPRDARDPIMTIRRIIARGNWGVARLEHEVQNDFGSW